MAFSAASLVSLLLAASFFAKPFASASTWPAGTTLFARPRR